MNLFGFSLPSLFRNRDASKPHKGRMTKKHVKTGRYHNKRRNRGTRKYKMRGGWGQPSLPLPNPSNIMKGGWGSDYDSNNKQIKM